MEIIHIIDTEFLKAATRYVHQSDLSLRTGHAILATFHDILLARTGCLHHLIDRAVTVSRKITLTKGNCQLIDRIAFAIEI